LSSISDPQRLVEVVSHSMFREVTARETAPIPTRPLASGKPAAEADPRVRPLTRGDCAAQARAAMRRSARRLAPSLRRGPNVPRRPETAR
jgi:hypothetical protein